MTNELKQQIITGLESYMKMHDLSQNKVADKSGVNAAYLGAMRAGDTSVQVGTKTVAISDKHYQKVAEFIGFEIRKTYWHTQPTAQLGEMVSILEDARNFAYTNIILGETGSGKTYAAKLFAQNNPNDFILITVSQLDNIGDLLDKVIERLGIAPARTKAKKLKDVCKKLLDMERDGFKPTLAFDECEYMKQATLCAIKELHDNLHGHAAIVLIGTHQLHDNILRLVKRQKTGMPQFYRRVKFGIRALTNINKNYELFFNGLSSPVKKMLRDECDNYGELHDVLVASMREADRTGEELTVDFIKRVLFK